MPIYSLVFLFLQLSYPLWIKEFLNLFVFVWKLQRFRFPASFLLFRRQPPDAGRLHLRDAAARRLEYRCTYRTPASSPLGAAARRALRLGQPPQLDSTRPRLHSSTGCRRLRSSPRAVSVSRLWSTWTDDAASPYPGGRLRRSTSPLPAGRRRDREPVRYIRRFHPTPVLNFWCDRGSN